MAVVTFDFNRWVALFPEFNGVGPELGASYFELAELFFRNDPINPAARFGTMERLMYLATSHVAWLNAPRGPDGNPSSCGTPASPLVGNITSATEGSVTVQTQNDYPPGSAQWWQQTRYGAMFWAATSPFRRFLYVANPTVVPSAIFPASPFIR